MLNIYFQYCFYLLALDQVLRKSWSGLTTFGTSTGWSKKEHPGGAEIIGSHLFCGPNKRFIRFFVLRFMGCRPMGLPMIRPFFKECKSINM
jgi:hypothetical protein